eukprot:CAMPEP_0204347154 /NCGR_PEP_ID=MMETSP0469-20131031/27718_1 /ASSEMBLY_ACC=CAM_ASM_000384 /TAXON_ID=2969 /ORGANISM="Oxyrrhis marina" /LENGTH=317 /DNA_ID=CAMNT_0051332899 /DNA_START=127 /DNA_END=1083 /DNA_ORIENTATION=-
MPMCPSLSSSSSSPEPILTSEAGRATCGVVVTGAAARRMSSTSVPDGASPAWASVVSKPWSSENVARGGKLVRKMISRSSGAWDCRVRAASSRMRWAALGGARAPPSGPAAPPSTAALQGIQGRRHPPPALHLALLQLVEAELPNLSDGGRLGEPSTGDGPLQVRAADLQADCLVPDPSAARGGGAGAGAGALGATAAMRDARSASNSLRIRSFSSSIFLRFDWIASARACASCWEIPMRPTPDEAAGLGLGAAAAGAAAWAGAGVGAGGAALAAGAWAGSSRGLKTRVALGRGSMQASQLPFVKALSNWHRGQRHT